MSKTNLPAVTSSKQPSNSSTLLLREWNSRLDRSDATLTDDQILAVIKRFDDDSVLCGTAYAAERVGAIMRFYPKNEVQNPVEYASGMTSIFADYPRGIVDIVSDPRTGIVRQQKYVPRIAEVDEVCLAKTKRRHRLRNNAALIIFRRTRKDDQDYPALQAARAKVGLLATN
jgi:hypothetical protein